MKKCAKGHSVPNDAKFCPYDGYQFPGQSGINTTTIVVIVCFVICGLILLLVTNESANSGNIIPTQPVRFIPTNTTLTTPTDSFITASEIPACLGPLPTRLSVGQNAVVTTSGKAWQLRLRSEPGFNSSTNHIIAAGRRMVILDGPVCSEGSYWWYVRSEQGYEGWAPEGDYEDYWIDPLN
jgi:hypothetical protein